MTARPTPTRRPLSLLGLAVLATLLALGMALACSSSGSTANDCGGTLPIYNVRIDGAVPQARVAAAKKHCVTLPGHAQSALEGGQQ